MLRHTLIRGLRGQSWFLLLVLLITTPVATAAEKNAMVAEVSAILQAKADAWNRGDAQAWSQHYAENAGFINIFGMHFPDRKTNIERHAAIFDGFLRGTTLKVEPIRLLRLEERLVLAETRLT